ncbi:MAG: phytoene dehydrogenase-like protein [Natronomonas sp.]|jgi:phytoene dehydrogenase-like protein|uniref:NAD(P)/FAD-dependent oxidoreductase n=1 Tax=Natronomonas sp. TaxID=2184060 RepID=UPI003989BAB5
MHVVVAGGGLAGLVTARRLAAAGATVELFEAKETVGGRVRSRTVDGFTLDRGFQVLFTGYPAAQRELEFDDLNLRTFSPGATIAEPNHRSTLADPLGDPGAAVATLLNRDVRTSDKLRLFRLQRELRGHAFDELFTGDETTIREYLFDRGFSRAFVERFAEPFYGGITLDRSLSTSSRVFEYTFKALSEGETVVPAAGMGTIPEQLRRRAEDAGATVKTGRAVTDVQVDGDDITVVAENERVFPDAVVVATDPKEAGELTSVETPTDAKACVTVHCSLLTHQSLDTGSRILLNAADERPNTVAPMSAAAPEYAPEDEQLLSATFLGDRAESDAELLEATREALDAWYPENHFGALELVGIDRIEFAQFAQSPGFFESLPAVDAPDGPVFLAGDYTRWSSIQGALESGTRAADAVLEELQ